MSRLTVTLGLLAAVAALCAAGVGVLALRSDPKPLPPPLNRNIVSTFWSVTVGGRPRVVLRDRGWQDGSLAARRDGSLLFVRPTSLTGTALFELVPGGRPRRLRALPIFAPIAYSSARDELAVSRGRAIVAETLSGRTVRVLARLETVDSVVPVWSADGSTLAFADQVRTRTNPYQGEIVVLRGPRRRTFRLAGGAYPQALSPRGDRLAYVWGMSLYLLDVKTGHRRLLAARGSYVGAWSPDGRSLAFDDVRGLVLLDLASGRSRVLSERGATGVTFAPDGRSLVYVTVAAKQLR